VKQLDVQPVRAEPGEPRDPVALLEARDELLPGVVGGVEPVEPERERRRLPGSPTRKTP
jgi:hypothetical protein